MPPAWQYRQDALDYRRRHILVPHGCLLLLPPLLCRSVVPSRQWGGALSSDLSSLPMILGLSIGMLLAGQSSQYVDYVPRYVIISIIVASGSSGLLLTWTPHTSKAARVWKIGLSGLGQRLDWQQPFSISQIILPKKDLPVGTTLMSGC